MSYRHTETHHDFMNLSLIFRWPVALSVPQSLEGVLYQMYKLYNTKWTVHPCSEWQVVIFARRLKFRFMNIQVDALWCSMILRVMNKQLFLLEADQEDLLAIQLFFEILVVRRDRKDWKRQRNVAYLKEQVVEKDFKKNPLKYLGQPSNGIRITGDRGLCPATPVCRRQTRSGQLIKSEYMLLRTSP